MAISKIHGSPEFSRLITPLQANLVSNPANSEDIPDQELDQHIHVISQKENKPKAEVIRELLETGIRKQHPMSTGEALLGLAKLGEKLGIDSPTDLSERYDDYLYGEKN